MGMSAWIMTNILHCTKQAAIEREHGVWAQTTSSGSEHYLGKVVQKREVQLKD